MRIVGKSLKLVCDALKLADRELHNQIVTCPDVVAYADKIEAIEAERREVAQLLDAVERCVRRERMAERARTK